MTQFLTFYFLRIDQECVSQALRKLWTVRNSESAETVHQRYLGFCSCEPGKIQFRILWCDDERTYFISFCQPQRFGKNFLQHHFAEFENRITVAFASGLKNVEEQYIKKNRFDFDLVISDVNFGESPTVTDRLDEGVKILEYLKQRYPGLDVILVTQYSDTLSVQTYLRRKKAEMVEWLEKSKKGGIPSVCKGIGKHKRLGAETICTTCGEPFDPFWYELKQLLVPRFKYLMRVKELEHQYRKKSFDQIVWESPANSSWRMAEPSF